MQITLAGITIKANDDLRITWMSDWGAWKALADTGFVTGSAFVGRHIEHYECYLTDLAIEAATPKAPVSAMLKRCQEQGDLYR